MCMAGWAELQEEERAREIHTQGKCATKRPNDMIDNARAGKRHGTRSRWLVPIKHDTGGCIVVQLMRAVH